ncbi:HAD family hydrolase [Haloactinomyces albus]|uniref:Hydroxymethylpyrimidine pyrophosphatase-like HAD family hydrolase n=1 Tax=Haloactinomyces albus TaxID=1352928 RepID=A0AAE3ZDK2_9ACTN|nr:HAD family hydrolase [Haloactinomyces albus]MDR7301880.1 hydroxymethylpyrimidine pyrophosphatase-like HAD family hydrolase [Haloactinomyces albus]
MRKPGLVASDVDGTLLDPWERVSSRTARTVQRVVASGTPFVLVTGRPPRWVPQIVDGLGLPGLDAEETDAEEPDAEEPDAGHLDPDGFGRDGTSPERPERPAADASHGLEAAGRRLAGLAVCANGAVVYDTARDVVLRTSGIGPVLLHDVTRELREAIPGCSFAVERSTHGARDRLDEQFLAEEEFVGIWSNADLRVVPADELVGKPAAKLLVLHDRLTSGEMAAAAAEVVGTQLQVTYSTGAGLLELSASGVDKASGLASIAEEFGVDRSDVLAFGDMPNDVAMLDWAGHGVAVHNAHPDALEIADEVTAANSADGVAQVLERWW